MEAIEVLERQFTINDISRAFQEGKLVQAFVCGTAFFVTPVSLICHHDSDADYASAEDMSEDEESENEDPEEESEGVKVEDE